MRAMSFRRAIRHSLLCLLVCFATIADAQFLLRTVRVTPPPPANPSALINFSGWELALPVSRALSSGTGSPYAGGQLKYDCSTATSIAQSENATVVPIGTYSSDWFRIQQAPDGQYEVLFLAPVWGSPSSPCAGGSTSDHTRTELRQLTPGPSNSGASKGDFKIADRGRLTLVTRPLRFPDRDRNNVATTTGNNLTLAQIHPISDGAASSVFSILLLRKNGDLEATLTNADGTSATATPYNQPLDLLTGVQLGDVLWIELTTEADRLEWRAENRTRAAGTIVTMTQQVPNVLSAGLSQRTRYQYFKAGYYHGTQPDYSTDAAEVVGGVLDPALVSDYGAAAIRSISYTFLGP